MCVQTAIVEIPGSHSRCQWSQTDPEKIKAITQLQELTDIHKLKRALGMINYMSKYIPDLASAAGPLYDLLKG